MKTPWRDSSVLRYLRSKGLTYEEMAEELGCHESTVQQWMSHHGLNGFLSSDRQVYFFTSKEDGYVQIHDTEKTGSAYVHQLLAIHNGADPHEVFGGRRDGLETHHVTDLPWLNYPENIVALTSEEHRRVHSDDSEAQPEAVA